MLSLNDHPDAHSIFGQVHQTEARTTYSVGSKKIVEEAAPINTEARRQRLLNESGGSGLFAGFMAYLNATPVQQVSLRS